MNNFSNMRKIRWITVGTKILFGVTLISNLFIGSLLYINLRASATVQETVNDVLSIREELSTHLRKTIVDLQKEFLSLPGFFKSDSRKKILETIDREFQIAQNQIVKGRENYQKFYSRQVHHHANEIAGQLTTLLHETTTTLHTLQQLGKSEEIVSRFSPVSLELSQASGNA